MARVVLLLAALATLAGCADPSAGPGEPGSFATRLNGRAVFQGNAVSNH